MEDIKKALCEELSHFPRAEIKDAVKFIYQSVMGPGHMIKDREKSFERLIKELEETVPADTPEYPLWGGLSRLNLGYAKGRLSAETVNEMFIFTANSRKGDLIKLKKALLALYDFFDRDEVSKFISAYEKAGHPPVSHSEAYRQIYRPAYRVVEKMFITFIEAFEALDKLLSGVKDSVIIAVDGPCGSGKSTLGGLLAEVYGGNIFRADDFFLPPKLRTPERFNTPGGNMYRERLYEEIISPVKEGKDVVYRCFDCSKMALGETVTAEKRRVNIIEGSYSQHPNISGAYDLKIFVKTDRDTQRERIIRRGDDIAAFNERWIPLENRYFEAFNIESAADLVIET